ncbi:MAG: hypothetical protein ACHP82_09240 [Hyphomicrobiales bacterium]
MPNIPPGAGNDMEVTAMRPMDAYLEKERIRLGTRLKDGRDLYIWMSKDDFAASLSLLQLAAHRLGAPWPKPLSGPGFPN